MVGDDVPAVDHVEVPARAVGQRQPRDADLLAVGKIDQPPPHPAGDGVFVFAAGDQLRHGGQLLPQPLLLGLDGGPGQGVAAAPDGPLAPDADVAAVGAGGVVQPAEVEQAGVALHLGALKAAADAGRVGLRLGRPLQDGVPVQVQLHVAVPEQGPTAVDSRREIDAVPHPAGVEGPLQSGGVVGHAVPCRAEGRGGNVEAAFGRFGPGPHPAQRPDLDLIACVRRKAPQGEVGLAGAAAARAVQKDVVPRSRPGGQLPIDGEAVRSGEGIDVCHTAGSFLKNKVSASVYHGGTRNAKSGRPQPPALFTICLF